MLFINYMINAGGMSLAVGMTVGHSQMLCMSEFSDDKLLPAIDQYKVSSS